MPACTTAPAVHLRQQGSFPFTPNLCMGCSRHCISTESHKHLPKPLSLIYNLSLALLFHSPSCSSRPVQVVYSTQSPLPLSSPVSPTTSATTGRSWSVSRGTASCTPRMLSWRLPSTGPWVSVRPGTLCPGSMVWLCLKCGYPGQRRQREFSPLCCVSLLQKGQGREVVTHPKRCP